MLVKWVHLSAAVLWLGAVCFHALGLDRAARLGKDRAARLGRVAALQAFAPFVPYALAALAVSGAFRLHWHIDGAYHGLTQTAWGRLLIVKWLIIACLAALGALLSKRLLPELLKAHQAGRMRAVAHMEDRISAIARTQLILVLLLLLVIVML